MYTVLGFQESPVSLEINKVVAFGFQAFIQEYLIDYFNDHFFSRPLEEVVERICQFYRTYIECQA